jgi:hypothetical protein
MALNDAGPCVDDEQFKMQRSQGIPFGRLATTDAALPVDGGYNQI